MKRVAGRAPVGLAMATGTETEAKEGATGSPNSLSKSRLQWVGWSPEDPMVASNAVPGGACLTDAELGQKSHFIFMCILGIPLDHDS